MTFRELGLIDPIVKALQQEGYSQPTPIQQGAIPPALKGRDVLGCAQTGTGKTCAFAAPILQRLNSRKPDKRVIRALILTPTRELAIQIGDSFSAYGRNLPLRHTVIFGGVGQQPQVDAVKKGLDILVATPGRLLDLHGQALLDLSHIEIFVLDEADRMLDMGFIHDVKRVIKLLPKQKQTLFFSATMPPEVMELVDSLLHNYARVAVDPVSSPVEVIRQSLYYVDKGNKTKLLAHLIEEMKIPSALVFSRTKHGANRIAQDLNKKGISAAAIHGNKSQTARVQALNDFKAGRVRVLVATDIAARGIDIEELSHVFNYNLPDVAETYVHRIGRTGRAGHDGVAISFCQFDEKDDLKAIEKLLGRAIPVVEGHPFPMVDLNPPQKDKHGRPVNAEDAEARAAAKERRRQRDAENKARAEAKKQAKAEQEAKQAAPQPAPVPEEKPGDETPAKKKRRRKKKKSGSQQAAQTVEQPAVPVEKDYEDPIRAAKTYTRERAMSRGGTRQGKLEDAPGNAPALSGDPDDLKSSGKVNLPFGNASHSAADSRRPRSAGARGVRQGKLEDTLPAQPAMPVTDFVKPNPLDSDVIMDATARLLAPRRPVTTAPIQPKAEKKDGQSKKKQSDPKQEQEKKQGPRKKAAPQPKQPHPVKEPPVQTEEPAPKKKKKRRRSDNKPRPLERSLYARQKDSTEQASLMRPYYISHDED